MKTIVIWDMCGQDNIKFAVLDGDYSHLHQVYINRADDKEAKQDELGNLFYDASGKTKVKLYSKFPYKTMAKPGTIVITCGFLP